MPEDDRHLRGPYDFMKDAERFLSTVRDHKHDPETSAGTADASSRGSVSDGACTLGHAPTESARVALVKGSTSGDGYRGHVRLPSAGKAHASAVQAKPTAWRALVTMDTMGMSP